MLQPLVLLLAGTLAPQEDLERIIAAMEKRVEAVKDLRASLRFTSFEQDPKTKERKPKEARVGTLAFRASGEAGWSVRPLEGDASYYRWADREKGLRVALSPDQ